MNITSASWRDLAISSRNFCRSTSSRCPRDCAGRSSSSDSRISTSASVVWRAAFPLRFRRSGSTKKGWAGSVISTSSSPISWLVLGLAVLIMGSELESALLLMTVFLVLGTRGPFFERPFEVEVEEWEIEASLFRRVEKNG